MRKNKKNYNQLIGHNGRKGTKKKLNRYFGFNSIRICLGQ